MAGVDASHRIVADLLRARTGQHLSEARMWRVPSALAGLFRARGISNVDQLVCLLAAPDARDLATEVVEALLNNETYFLCVDWRISISLIPQASATFLRSGVCCGAAPRRAGDGRTERYHRQ